MRHALPLLVLLTLAALPARGQGLSAFVAADPAAGTGAHAVGASLDAQAGPFGFRTGGAVRLGGRPGAPRWRAEADLLLYPGGDRGIVRPYALAGAALLPSAGAYDVAPHATLGAGVRLRPSRRLGLLAEARFTAPVDGGALLGHAGAWDLRTGITLHLGGRRRAPRPAATPVVAPRATRRVHVRDLPGATAAPMPAPARALAAAGLRVVDTGERFLGTRYVWGAETPGTGFDCSGFVQYVYRHHGVVLPRVSRDQARAGQPLPLDLDALVPGDLLFFAGNGHRVDHVGIYAGDGMLLHASKGNARVAYDRLRRGDWFMRHLVAARRVLR